MKHTEVPCTFSKALQHHKVVSRLQSKACRMLLSDSCRHFTLDVTVLQSVAKSCRRMCRWGVMLTSPADLLAEHVATAH